MEREGVRSKEGHKQFGRRDVVRNVVRKKGRQWLLGQYLCAFKDKVFSRSICRTAICPVGVSCGCVL